MDCKHARLLVEMAHPIATELDARDAEELAAHLAQCPDCGPWADQEGRIDDHLGTAIRAVPVPADLQMRIKRRLSVERDARHISWIRRGAAAAVVLLAVGLSSAVYWHQKPKPDLDQFAHDVGSIVSSQELVESWFAERKIKMIAPPRFDYSNLKSQGLVEFQGRSVPCLFFVYSGPQARFRGAFAQVLVLSDRQFNLDEVRDQPAPQASQHHIKILELAGNPTVLFLVVTEEAALEALFFKNHVDGNE
jgi:hypothetical protein